MPAALAMILPMLLGFGGSYALPKLLGRAGGSASLAGKVPKAAGMLGRAAGSSLTPLAGFFAGQMLGDYLFAPHSPEENSDDANFARLAKQMQQGPPTSSNDLEFLRLLQRQNLEGGLRPALEEAGVNMGALV